MAGITKQQREAIRSATRRANRRLERATEGQRRYLETQLNRMGLGNKFSAATKGMTAEQAASQIKKLNTFLSAKSSTRKGWDSIKKEQVKKAADYWNNQGYNITDDELADILEQLGDKSKQAYYQAVNKVEAAKIAAGDDWEGSSEEIADALAVKESYQQSLKRALKAREAQKK